MPAPTPPPEDAATVTLAQVVRRVLGSEGGEGKSSEQVVAGVGEAWTRLSQHLSSLIGYAGVKVLFDRSLALTAAQFPWIATVAPPVPPDPPWIPLRACLEAQDPDVAIEASVALMTTFLELLGMFIGEPLTLRILHVVWPNIAPTTLKEAT